MTHYQSPDARQLSLDEWDSETEEQRSYWIKQGYWISIADADILDARDD